MARAEDTQARLYQNLIDAGYGEDMAKYCLSFAQNGEWNRLCNELAKHKTVLLATLHKSEKQIDCLDYLVYEINRKYLIGGKQNA
ncbi:MAG: hypothetical protein J1E81_09115 [Eubacterium sp.]|nr:hypothetical protein [Eubacterium sp.]